MAKNCKLIAHLFAHGKEPKESRGGSTDRRENIYVPALVKV